MPSSCNNDYTVRYRTVGSRTPLYYEKDKRFYWKHCWYCGVELIQDPNAKKQKANSFTRDHIHPASQGGKNGINTVPCCKSCNARKRALSLEEFRQKFFEHPWVFNYGSRTLITSKLFYGEFREQQLREELARREIKPTIREQLSVILPPMPPVFIPKTPRGLVRLETILHTPLSRLLRRFFT